MATEEETDRQVLLRAGHQPNPCVCPGMVFRLQETRTGLVSTLGIHAFSCRKGGGEGECENRWKCNFLMTAADGKKTQECIHTMSEPCESAWPSQNVHGGAVVMAPPTNPEGGPAAGRNRPQGGVGHTARLHTATGGWQIPVATWWELETVRWLLQTWHYLEHRAPGAHGSQRLGSW